MSANAQSSVFGSKWFEKYLSFRKNPDEIMKLVDLSEGKFHLDILKDLCSESLDMQYKIHLLLFLQGNVPLLLSTVDKLEQTVGSLRSYYEVLRKTKGLRLLKSQLLITMTTVLLSHEDEDGSLLTLLPEIKDLLIQVITKQHTTDPLLCATACKCLEEIEIFVPNALQTSLEHIWEHCQQETTPAFQCYASLLSLAMKNAVIAKTRQKGVTNVATDDAKAVINRLERYPSSPTSPMSNEIEVFPVVMYILDHLPVMTSASIHHIMRYLINIVRYSHELLPITFKTWAPRLMLTSDVPLFHMAFDMLKIFGSELFTIQEEQALHQQLLLCANHSALSPSQRLLYLDWILSNLENKKMPSYNMSHRSLGAFLPGPYDGLDIQEKKLKILAHCINPEHHPEFLMACLTNLKKTALKIFGVRAFSSLFRTLYFFYTFHKSSVLKTRIFRFTLDLVISIPLLSPHLLDFLECIRVNVPESSLTEDTLMALVEHIINLSVNDVLKNFINYLLVLEKAAKETADVCRPKKVLYFLQKLLTQKDVCEKGDWLLGNSILSVCRSILEFQNMEFLYRDLGEVLYIIMTDFEDVDVKMRARLYYAALTSLQSSKVKELLKQHLQIKETTNSLTSLVTDRSSAFYFRKKIHYLDHSVLRLIRVKKNFILDDNPNMSWNDHKLTKEDSDKYKSFVSDLQFHPHVQVPLLLQLTQDVEDKFQTLYGVVISVHGVPSCGELEDIEVPVITKSKDGATGHNITLDIWPHKPRPLTLHFRAEFTCKDAQSYTSPLPSLELEFQDLFLPLPVIPDSSMPDLVWKRVLFNTLWNNLTEEAAKGFNVSSCQESIHRLETADSNVSSFVERNFKPFLIHFSGESAVFHVGIFLPSSCHLLMKVKVLNEALYIQMLTDNFNILPLVNVYLKTLESR